ncbi:hypothetical protein TNCV_1826671 [Trichonephila clavipes]|nr:hypothetical protein TNCV_1826671 [Trichonephila clavipes]
MGEWLRTGELKRKQQESIPGKNESKLDPDEIGKVIEEVLDLARQINLEVDNDDVQELLDSNNQEQEQNIEREREEH